MSLSLNSSKGSRSSSIAGLLDENLGRTQGLGHEIQAGRDSIWSQSDNGSISADMISRQSTLRSSKKLSQRTREQMDLGKIGWMQKMKNASLYKTHQGIFHLGQTKHGSKTSVISTAVLLLLISAYMIANLFVINEIKGVTVTSRTQIPSNGHKCKKKIISSTQKPMQLKG